MTGSRLKVDEQCGCNNRNGSASASAWKGPSNKTFPAGSSRHNNKKWFNCKSIYWCSHFWRLSGREEKSEQIINSRNGQSSIVNTAPLETEGVLNMQTACPRPGSWIGSSQIMLVLLLLVLLLRDSSAQTAYLVGSQQQAYEASNSSFNSLGAILRAQPAYSSIVLTEDYYMNPGEFQAVDPVRLSQPLLITSSPGQQYQLSFAFLVRLLQSSGSISSCRSAGWQGGRGAPAQAGVGCSVIVCWGGACRQPRETACGGPGTCTASHVLRCRVGADRADWLLLPRRTTSC
jgi:hypothetical protein